MSPTPRRTWLSIAGASALGMAGVGWMIWTEHDSIETARADVAAMRAEIDAARKLLGGTAALEREVIVMRETEEAIEEILPDEQDVNNFVRDLRRFEEDSGVRITGLKRKDQTSQKKQGDAFDKVVYEVTFEADAFQLLAFVDLIESHARFTRVPSFSLQAAPRKQVEDKGAPAHKVKLEVETYVYRRQEGPAPAKIEGYARKRELLLGEISRHRQALAIDTYRYRGARGRRDPWVDPRIPVASQDPSALPVQEQSQIVDDLIARVGEVQALWADVQAATTVVIEMQLRAELEPKLAALEEEVRRHGAEGTISFKPAQRRLELDVQQPLVEMRQALIASTGGNGPTVDELRELLATMKRHLAAGEPELSLHAYATVEPNLDFAAEDPLRKGLVDALRRASEEARILSDFARLDVKIQGVLIADGTPPVALINGRAISEGDLVNDELVVRGIRQGEIEFIFRGVKVLRRW
jgi:Tfp pilus assembly protein PilO